MIKNGGIILAIGDIIVGIDIGTSKVSSVIGEVNNFNQVEIIATAECKCSGMKKTKIADEEEVAAAIAKTIAEVEQVENCLEKAEELREHLRGVLVVVGESAGTVGKIPDLVETNKKVVLGDLFDVY